VKRGCFLLDRVPTEIRLRIWEFAVGGRVLHLVRKMGRIVTYTCNGKCHSANRLAAQKARDTERRAKLLCLPLTCTTMYAFHSSYLKMKPRAMLRI
jgi:hypothetical protein